MSCGAVQVTRRARAFGIGQPDPLRNYGIAVKHELKGVGENYGDHFAPRVRSAASTSGSRLNEQTRGASAS